MGYLPEEEEEGNYPYPRVEYSSSSCDPSQSRRYRSDQGARYGRKGCLLFQIGIDSIVPGHGEHSQTERDLSCCVKKNDKA